MKLHICVAGSRNMTGGLLLCLAIRCASFALATAVVHPGASHPRRYGDLVVLAVLLQFAHALFLHATLRLRAHRNGQGTTVVPLSSKATEGANRWGSQSVVQRETPVVLVGWGPVCLTRVTIWLVKRSRPIIDNYLPSWIGHQSFFSWDKLTFPDILRITENMCVKLQPEYRASHHANETSWRNLKAKRVMPYGAWLKISGTKCCTNGWFLLLRVQVQPSWCVTSGCHLICSKEFA